MDLSQVKCDLPYPEVNVAKDLSEARLILPNYAGRDSETTAILTYAYQSYMTADLKKILEEISIVEMTHHEMLGEAIVKLGGYPIIGNGCFWKCAGNAHRRGWKRNIPTRLSPCPKAHLPLALPSAQTLSAN